MSFLRSPITAGPMRPSVLTGIFSYQSHCFCVFVYVFVYIYIYFFIISNYSTTLSSGAHWWTIDKPPVF